ncbi:hypothetical protein Cni_G26113 [Canna indica]|uniref:DUF659 domain-containing protein n=1 Tax=Canna indica TaxID=4628 RepID=A0AAQ3KYD3_9LILI|nr:hypothetical protein Cni_G26113 [Canna indica]
MRVPQSRGGIRGFFTNLEASGRKTNVDIFDLDPRAFPPPSAKQSCIDDAWGKTKKWELGRAISNWFHFSRIPAYATNNPYYRTMVSTIQKVGLRRVVYHKSVNSSDEIHDAYYISKLMTEVIEEIGPQNVVQVMIDNRANFKRVGEIIEQDYPPCAAHCVDLLMKDIGDILMVKSTVKKAQQITHFIYNHTWVYALMKKFTKGKIHRPGVTHFAINFIALRSLQQKKAALRTMFTKIIVAVEPLYKVLRQVDMEKTPQMSHLYHYIHQAQEEIKRVISSPAKSYNECRDPTEKQHKLLMNQNGSEMQMTILEIHLQSSSEILWIQALQNEDRDILHVDQFNVEFVQGDADPIIDWWSAMEIDPPLLDEPGEPPWSSPIIFDSVEFESQPEDTDNQSLERDMTLAPLDSQRAKGKGKGKRPIDPLETIAKAKEDEEDEPSVHSSSSREYGGDDDDDDGAGGEDTVAPSTPAPTDLWTNEQYVDLYTQDQDHGARTGGTTWVYEKRGRRRGGGPTALQDYHDDMMSSLQEVSESTYSV